DEFFERFVAVRPNASVHAETSRTKTLLVQSAQLVDGHIQAFGGVNLIVNLAARAGGLEPRDERAQFCDDFLAIQNDAPLPALGRGGTRSSDSLRGKEESELEVQSSVPLILVPLIHFVPVIRSQVFGSAEFFMQPRVGV